MPRAWACNTGSFAPAARILHCPERGSCTSRHQFLLARWYGNYIWMPELQTLQSESGTIAGTGIENMSWQFSFQFWKPWPYVHTASLDSRTWETTSPARWTQGRVHCLTPPRRMAWAQRREGKHFACKCVQERCPTGVTLFFHPLVTVTGI